MLTYKRSILFLVLLAGGFTACSSSSNSNTQPTVIGGSTGAAGDMGAGGNGGNIGAGGVVAMDADVGGGGAIALDAAPVDSPVVVGVDAAPADSAPSGTADGGPVADGGLLVADSAVAPAVCPTPTKAGNLAIINGPAAAGVIPLDVTGSTPPVYDPATNTCQ
jgi:hypothetical protein